MNAAKSGPVEHLRRALRDAWAKNNDEIRAYLDGQMPLFVTGRGEHRTEPQVPALVFHDVRPERLETQLRYLRDNGYRSVTADELVGNEPGSRTRERLVALTFDDAHWSFWAFAFPLLKRYGFHGILFAVPGVVPEDPAVYPSLDDGGNKEGVLPAIEARSRKQPLCTWRELEVMSRSGIVDVQSHSLLHKRVFVAPRLLDFLNPGFERDFCDFNVPVYSSWGDTNRREFRLGAPVFESCPRLACRSRFKEAKELVLALQEHVAARGGDAFFERPSWRQELTAICRRWPNDGLGSYETREEMESDVWREMSESRRILEERLGKEVRHFCFPWFAGSEKAEQSAAGSGYRALYYGPYLRPDSRGAAERPVRIRRIPEGYLFRLPGNGRASLWSVWKTRVVHSRALGSAA